MDPARTRALALAGASVVGAATVAGVALWAIARVLEKAPPVRVSVQLDPADRKLLLAYLPVAEKMADRGIDHYHHIGKRPGSTAARRPA